MVQRSAFSGWRGSLLILAPYLVALAVDGAVSGVVVPWPSVWAAVPTQFDMVALSLWAAIGAEFGRRVLTEAYISHSAGIAAVVAVTGYRKAPTDLLDALFGFVFGDWLDLAVIVLLVAFALWKIAGMGPRRKKPPGVRFILGWAVFPYVVLGLRWLG